MARIIAPQAFGAVLDIRGPRDGTLTLTAPDGIQVTIPAPNGKASVWLPQAGEWVYSWDGDTSGTITVLPSDAPVRVQHKVSGPQRWT